MTSSMPAHYPARRQDGSPTILSLGFLGTFVLPLLAVLLHLAITSVASVQAEGLAYGSAYQTVNRTFDIDNTGRLGAPQLFQTAAGSPDQYADARLRLTQAANANSFTRAFGVSYSLVPFPQAAPWAPAGGYGGELSVGIINVGREPVDAKQVADAQDPSRCATIPGSAYLPDPVTGSAACWRDDRTFDDDLARAGAFDHYTSGAQAVVETNVRTFINPGGLRIRRTGVASFGRPCAEGEGSCQQ